MVLIQATVVHCLAPVNSRQRAKEPHQCSWGLHRGKGANVLLFLEVPATPPPHLHWIQHKPAGLPVLVQVKIALSFIYKTDFFWSVKMGTNIQCVKCGPFTEKFGNPWSSPVVFNLFYWHKLSRPHDWGFTTPLGLQAQGWRPLAYISGFQTWNYWVPEKVSLAQMEWHGQLFQVPLPQHAVHPDFQAVVAGHSSISRHTAIRCLLTWNIPFTEHSIHMGEGFYGIVWQPLAYTDRRKSMEVTLRWTFAWTSHIQKNIHIELAYDTDMTWGKIILIT